MEISGELLAKADEFEAQSIALQEMSELLRKAAEEISELGTRLENAEAEVDYESRRRMRAEQELDALRYETRRVEFLN